MKYRNIKNTHMLIIKVDPSLIPVIKASSLHVLPENGSEMK